MGDFACNHAWTPRRGGRTRILFRLKSSPALESLSSHLISSHLISPCRRPLVIRAPLACAAPLACGGVTDPPDAAARVPADSACGASCGSGPHPRCRWSRVDFQPPIALMDASLARKVREREGHACEYCRMPQAYDPAVPFPIDHVIARQHGGPTTPGNLALSCLHDLAYALSPEVVSQPARRSDGGPPKPMDSLPWLHKVILVEEVKDPQGRLWYAHKATRTRLEPGRPRPPHRHRPLSSPGEGAHQLSAYPAAAPIRSGPAGAEGSLSR